MESTGLHDQKMPADPGNELQGVRLVRTSMPLRNLPEEFEGAKLAHISDLHCGPMVSWHTLERQIEAVNRLAPDFVVITGDFITFGSRRDALTAARLCGRIEAKSAVLACLGNHDYGVWHPNGLGGKGRVADALADELAHQGVIVLRNACRAVFRDEAVLQFVGVDDYWTRHYGPQEAFELAAPDTPTVALVHNPDAAIELAAWQPDWVLAGHTHGQPTPDTRFWNMAYPTRHKQFVAGGYRVGPRTRLRVSRGIGGSFFRPASQCPEITLFTLCMAEAKTPHPLFDPSPTHEIGAAWPNRPAGPRCDRGRCPLADSP